MAISLAKQGKKVILFEKSFLEGSNSEVEVLQPAALQQLSNLGLSHCLEEADAKPISGYSICSINNNNANLAYNSNRFAIACNRNKLLYKLREIACSTRGYCCFFLDLLL